MSTERVATANDEQPHGPQHEGAAGGWGALKGIARTALHDRASAHAVQTLAEQNKPGGFMCSSCAWAKPSHPHPFEFCEKGAKSTLWELTRDRCTPEFFGTQTIEALLHWQDYDLELQGRLTEPMRYATR
jgi:anaerobic selenocysteine-containing dehydrogenase